MGFALRSNPRTVPGGEAPLLEETGLAARVPPFKPHRDHAVMARSSDNARARQGAEVFAGTARPSSESSAELVDVGADGVVCVLRVGVTECFTDLAGGPAEERNRPLE